MKVFAASLCFLLIAPLAHAGAGPFAESSLDIRAKRSGLHWAHFNGDELPDLLIADDKQFYLYLQTGSGFTDVEPQIIPAPEGAIYDLADLDKDGISEIILLHRDGVDKLLFDAAANGLTQAPKPLVADLRGTSVQHLIPADVVTDIDNDGHEDLIYPVDGKYYLFFNRGGEFTKENQLDTKPISVRVSMGEDRLRDSISSTVSIPGIEFVELNGDGRKDLRVSQSNRESFYLQTADGNIPDKPTYEVDLARFKSERPQHEGLADELEQFQFIATDLNNDGRQDYTVVAGNKLWVFLATDKGVNFDKPDQILKVSAETMSVVLLPINSDDRPDLVIMKYQVPSMGRIVAGLAIGIRFDVEFLGYNNVDQGVFSRRPDHRSMMTFKVPPILKLLGELDSIVSDFRNVQNQAKRIAAGDFNGDGGVDVIKLENGAMNLYYADARTNRETDVLDDFEDSKFFDNLIFGEKQRDVTLDTLLGFFGDFVNSFTAAAIQGRSPSLNVPLGEEKLNRTERIFCHDLNGDGVDEIVLFLGQERDLKGQPLDPDNEMQTLSIWWSQTPPKG